MSQPHDMPPQLHSRRGHTKYQLYGLPSGHGANPSGLVRWQRV